MIYYRSHTKPILPTFFKRPHNSGFSLMELVVALSVFSIGILGVMQMGLLATRNIASGDVVTQAVLHAQGELEEIKTHRSLVDLRDTYPKEPKRQGYFLVSYEFSDPLAEEIDEPSLNNCGTSEYAGSGRCLAKVTVSWKRGGGGRGGSGEVVLKTMLGEAS